MTWGGRRVAQLRAAVIAVWGSVCVLCHEPIDLRRRHPDPASFTIEHLVCRSAGGTDDLANLRPAHLGCNSARSDRPAPSNRRPRRTGQFFLAAAGPEVPPLPVSPRAPRKNPEINQNPYPTRK